MDVPIPIFCGPIIRRDTSRPCSVYFDVTILPGADGSEPLELESLQFDNYFTSSISLSQLNTPTSSTGKGSSPGKEQQPPSPEKEGNGSFYSILDNRRLMSDPTLETGAQSSFTVHVSEFNEHYVSGKVIRFHLFQPASIWKTYELKHITAFAKPIIISNKSITSDLGGDEFRNIHDQMRSDFKTIVARSIKVAHTKQALGSQLDEVITMKKKKKKAKSTTATSAVA